MLKMLMRFVACCAVLAVPLQAVADDVTLQKDGLDQCRLERFPNGVRAVRATHTRTLSVVHKVLAIAKPSVPLHICETLGTESAPAAMLHQVKQNGVVAHAFLVIPRIMAERFSDRAFLGTIAHEVAHLFLDVPPACDLGRAGIPVLAERLACEIPVDARAAFWVGARPLIAMLKETSRLTGPFVRPDIRRFIEQEAKSREQALRRRMQAATAPMRASASGRRTL
jgi:hypothetical protein